MIVALVVLAVVGLVLSGLLARTMVMLDRLTATSPDLSLVAVVEGLDTAATLTAGVAVDLKEQLALSDAQFGRLVVLLDRLTDSVDKGRAAAAVVASDLAASHAEADEADRVGVEPGAVADAGARTPKPRRR